MRTALPVLARHVASVSASTSRSALPSALPTVPPTMLPSTRLSLLPSMLLAPQAQASGPQRLFGRMLRSVSTAAPRWLLRSDLPTQAHNGPLPTLAVHAPAQGGASFLPSLVDRESRLQRQALDILLEGLEDVCASYRQVARQDLRYVADLALRQAEQRVRHLRDKTAAMPSIIDGVKDSERVYAGLKSVACWLRIAITFNPARAASTLALSTLADTVTQMARVEMHRNGVRHYDDEARVADRRLEEKMPHFRRAMNHNIEKNAGMGVSLSVDAGIGGSVSGNVAKSDLITSDTDGDVLIIKRTTTTLAGNAGFKVGPKGFRGGKLTVGLEGAMTRGELHETTTTAQAMCLYVRQQRDNTHMNTARTGRATSPLWDRFSDDLQRHAKQLREWVPARSKFPPDDARLRRLNVSATGPLAAVRRGLSTGWNYLTLHHGKQRFPQDVRRELTTEKLHKGAVPEMVAQIFTGTEGFHDFSFAVDPQALQDSQASLARLNTRLRAMYSNFPKQDNPLAFQRSELDGVWLSEEGRARFDASFLNHDFARGENGNFSVGGALSASVQGQRRNLPMMFWMAPHEVFSPTMNVDITVCRQRLEDALQKNPVLCRLARRMQTGLLTGRLGVDSALRELDQIRMKFEEHAQALLNGHAVAASRQGARAVGERAARAACAGLCEVFFADLSPHKRRRVERMAMHRPDDLIAACWNMVSLGLAALRLHEGAGLVALSHFPASTVFPVAPRHLLQASDRLADRIKNPGILIAPEVFYRNAAALVTGDVERKRITGSLDIRFGASGRLGKEVSDEFGERVAGVRGATAGVKLGLGAEVEYLDVQKHPNPVRNGQFLTVSIKPHDYLSEVPVKMLLARMADKFPAFARLGMLDARAEYEFSAALAGMTFSRGTVYAVTLRRPTPAADWGLHHMQRTVTRARNVGFGVSPVASLATASVVGASVAVGPSFSTGASVTRPTCTTFGGDTAIHLLQSQVLQSLLTDIGVTPSPDGGLIVPSVIGECGGARTMLIDRYFSNDCVLQILAKMMPHRLAVPVTTIRNDFDKLAAESFTQINLLRWRIDSPPSRMFSQCLERAGEDTRHMSAQERFNYFMYTENGCTLFWAYLEGVRYFSAMKTLAYFHEGQHVSALDIKTHSIDNWITRKQANGIDPRAMSLPQSSTSTPPRAGGLPAQMAGTPMQVDSDDSGQPEPGAGPAARRLRRHSS